MKTRRPTLHEIDELVSFLPRLYTEGFAPIRRWGGGTENQDGVFAMPWPEYDPVVEAFVRVASSECWTDYDYNPESAGQLLEMDESVQSADLDQIKTMLTYCVRGERFCSGHWEAMIESGNVRKLLQRLSELRDSARRTT